MKFDPAFDIYVALSADKYRGFWVNERQIKQNPKLRTAGRVPVGATPHTTLTIALINALESISRPHLEQLRTKLGKPGGKLRLKLVSTDATFADALRALMKADKATIAEKPMRAGRNLLRELARQLARYDVTLVTQRDDADDSFRQLRSWARNIDATRKPNAVAAFESAFPAFVASSSLRTDTANL